jgi:chromosome segregation ATPase
LKKEQVMAPDDRKGQPPATRGKSPAPDAPDTPDTRDINAPPPPEAPDAAEALEAPETPAEEPEAQPSTPSTVGDGSDPDVEQPAESVSERLRREIDQARQALEAKEAELARVEAQRLAEEATAKMVSEYSADVPALQALERDLRQYQTAETSALGEKLPAAVRAAIAEVHKRPEQEIAGLRTRVEQDEQNAAEARHALVDARQAAAAAKDKAEALKRPAASIRDRIKRADAVRIEATKASSAGRYALAYWLVMPGGRLERAIAAEPAVTLPEELGAAIKAAVAAQKEADERVETLTKQVETADAVLQQDRARLAELERSLEATVLAELSKLNPQTAAAA